MENEPFDLWGISQMDEISDFLHDRCTRTLLSLTGRVDGLMFVLH